MCELFGVSSPVKLQLNSLLREFFSHGYDHPDGWGIAFFDNGGASVEKEPVNSCRSDYLKYRLKPDIYAANMIAHIRLATKGSHKYENTHPFVRNDFSGRTWTLAHNGTIFESDSLNPFFSIQEGQTDSERILLYMIDRLNALTPVSAADRFQLMDEVLCEITPSNKVNLLVFDGELLYVHTNYANSLHMRREGAGMLFSTNPLGDGSWEPVPMNTLLAFRNGTLKFTGTNHGHEYFYSPAQSRHLYLDYAQL